MARREFKAIKKYLTFRNFILAGFAIILYLMFSNLAKAIIFMILFFPLGTFSVKISRILPQANVEIITPFSFFLGYFFGWPVGVFFGVILGLYMWSTAYSISQFILLTVFLNGITATLGSFFHSLGWVFGLSYFVAIIIREVLFWSLGLAIGGNPIENSMHTLTASITHLLLMPTFMFMLSSLVQMI